MTHKIVLPEMGEGVLEATILAWLKDEGDTVSYDTPILEIETDKVTVEINAEFDGFLLKTHVNVGDIVSVGEILATIGDEGDEVKAPSSTPHADFSTEARMSKPEEQNQTAVAQSSTATNKAVQHSRLEHRIQMSPVVARMVQEHQLDITNIVGTGRDGRITKRDVLAYLDTTPTHSSAEVPVEQTPVNGHKQSNDTVPTKNGVINGITTDIREPPSNAGQLVPVTGMRRAIAEHMVMSKRTSPHVTTVFEFDFSAVAAHRSANKNRFADDGVKLTYMPYIALATIESLKKHPMVNASWTGDGILLKREINLGIAVAVPTGLLVPVIKHAEDKNLLGLARTINDLAERGRTNRLKPDEVKGGTFSITNHGASGSLIGTPIINQPQVGIFGVGVIEKRVKVINDAITIRPCAFVSFSFDHRVLDGATADAFVMDIKRRVEAFTE